MPAETAAHWLLVISGLIGGIIIVLIVWFLVSASQWWRDDVTHITCPWCDGRGRLSKPKEDSDAKDGLGDGAAHPRSPDRV